MQTISDNTQTSNPDRAVPTRRLSFEESLRDLPKHYAAEDDLILSHLLATLSSVFPDGEDFFVRSVRHYRSQITDPQLKRQVAGFIGQESVHGREHRAFNDRLDQLGYPTKRNERITKRGLAFRERIMTPNSNLAATAALEHFTATLAEMILTDERARNAGGHRAVHDLFVWHALEESEHKAVAFDVYRAMGGSERTRVVTMKLMRIGFVVGMTFSLVCSLLGDRATYRRGNLRASLKRFKSTPLIQKDLWVQLCDYDRPDFHPDDRDTTELVAQWRERLFGEDGSMTNMLATSSTAA